MYYEYVFCSANRDDRIIFLMHIYSHIYDSNLVKLVVKETLNMSQEENLPPHQRAVKLARYK